MADNTKKTHTDKKWMIFLGCSFASPGCMNCWALTEALRQAQAGSERYRQIITTKGGELSWTGEILFQRELLSFPKKFRHKNIWVAPRSDPFHEKIPTSQIAEVFAVVADTPQNNFQFLTKRIERARKLFKSGELRTAVESILGRKIEWPLQNTWIGTSVENEKVSHRISTLMEIDTPVTYIAFQPLLGEIDVLKQLSKKSKKPALAIIGGEAGHGCRPFDRRALCSVRNQLQSIGVRTLTQCYPL